MLGSDVGSVTDSGAGLGAGGRLNFYWKHSVYTFLKFLSLASRNNPTFLRKTLPLTVFFLTYFVNYQLLLVLVFFRIDIYQKNKQYIFTKTISFSML